MPALLTLLGIEKGEERAALFLWLYSFFMGGSYVLFGAVAYTIFLAEPAFGTSFLPYFFMISAVVTTAVSTLYNWLTPRTAAGKLLIGTLLFLTLTVVGYRAALWGIHSKWVAFAVLCWNDALWILNNMLYWELAGRTFNLRQAKRLFGLISTGTIVAGILSTFGMAALIGRWGAPNLLWVVALSQAACVLVVWPLLKQATASAETEETNTAAPLPQPVAKWRDPAFLLLAAGATASILTFYFVEYVFYNQVELYYLEEAALGQFIGRFLGLTLIVNFLVKFFVSGRLLTRFGLRFGLAVLPVVQLLLVGTAALIGVVWGIVPALLWVMVASKMSDEVIRNALEYPSSIILFQPLPQPQRGVYQNTVEGIVKPLAGGLAGVVLLIYLQWQGLTAVPFLFLMLIVLGGWVAINLMAYGNYRAALIHALSQRWLGGGRLELSDAATVDILRQKLASDQPAEVIYALHVLGDADLDSRTALFTNLLSHPAPTVRRAALENMVRHHDTAAWPALRRHVEQEESETVLPALLLALCALSDDDTSELDVVAPYLEHQHPAVRTGAAVAMVRYSGLEGVLLAGERILHLAQGPDPRQRQLAAHIIGQIGLRQFYRPLLPLLRDADHAVRREALTAAPLVGHGRLWANVLANLEEAGLRVAAMAALAQGGPSALGAITERMAQEPNTATLVQLVSVLRRHPAPEALAYLATLWQHPVYPVRQAVLAALVARNQRLTADIEPHLRQELTAVTRALHLWQAWQAEPAARPLCAALLADVNHTRLRVLDLLTLRYGETIQTARRSLDSGEGDKAAYALEVLDTTLPQAIKTVVWPLVQTTLTPAERLAAVDLLSTTPVPSPLAQVRYLLAERPWGFSAWSRACALYLIQQTQPEDGPALAMLGIADASPLVRETAVLTLWRLDPTWLAQFAPTLRTDPSAQVRRLRRLATQQPKDITMLLTVEKVLILKTVPIFAAVPDEILVAVAEALQEVEIAAGEPLVTQGDPGNTLFILVRGRLRVHVGDETLAFLEERDIAGEMAVLDPGPRAASVSAVGHSHLLCLEREVLYELMQDHFDVLQAVLRVLTQRLRTAVSLIQEQKTRGQVAGITETMWAKVKEEVVKSEK